MKIIKTCLSAMISGILIFSPAYADKWSDQFPHIKATGDIPGDCSYEERCVLIKSAFIETGNISAASRKLGVSRTTIYKHLK
ncbi:hypothetical protein N9W29_01080 [Candidatus Pelagibacter bacterium]|nr:hypothetical protein [Candidatus Pelagibacter bacterium]